MEKAKFEKAKELEERIYQLNLLKKHMEVFLENKPFFTTLAKTILNVERFEPFLPISHNHDTLKHDLSNEEDKQAILSAIESRIIELQKQFDKL